MRIAVFVKQVPRENSVQMDPATGRIVREGAESIPNAADLRALEAALQLKESWLSKDFGKDGAASGEDSGAASEEALAEVCVFTMGPPQAKSVLYDALAMGADSAYLISDAAFGGADVFATSYTLQQAASAAGQFDLYVFGLQSSDGNTAQTGPAFAERLGLPFAGSVFAFSNATDFLEVSCRFTAMDADLRIPLPAVISVDPQAFVPRLPGLKAKLAAKRKPLETIGLSDLPDKEATHYGLRGSRTGVVRLHSPEVRDRGRAISATDPGAAEEVCNMIRTVLHGS